MYLHVSMVLLNFFMFCIGTVGLWPFIPEIKHLNLNETGHAAACEKNSWPPGWDHSAFHKKVKTNLVSSYQDYNILKYSWTMCNYVSPCIPWGRHIVLPISVRPSHFCQRNSSFISRRIWTKLVTKQDDDA
jgi:hypothetical protein